MIMNLIYIYEIKTIKLLSKDLKIKILQNIGLSTKTIVNFILSLFAYQTKVATEINSQNYASLLLLNFE